MSAFNRIQKIYINAEATGGGVNPITDSACVAETAPQWVAGDVFRLRVMFHVPAATFGSAAERLPLPDSRALLMAVKASRTAAATLLAGVTEWTAVMDEDGVGYEAILRLDGASLLTLSGAGNPVTVWVELELSDGAGNERITWQWQTTINPQVSAVGDTPPEYPPASDPALIAGKFAVAAGLSEVIIDSVGADNAAYSPSAVLLKPSAGAADIFIVCIHTVTAAGFHVILSAPTSEEGYYVSYLCR